MVRATSTRPSARRRAGRTSAVPDATTTPRSARRTRGGTGRRRGAVLAADDRGAYAVGATSGRSEGPPVAPSAAAPPHSRGQVDAAELGEVVDRLGALLDVPAATLEDRDADELRARVQLLRRVEGMTAAAMATTVGVLSRTGAIRDDGASSTTAWVAQQTGRSRREASRTTRLSGALHDMPATAAALAAGEVGPESADTIARAAQDGRLGTPAEVEATLLPIAAEGPDRLRSQVRRLTQQADGAAMLRDERQQHARRRFTLTQRDDGMWHPGGQLTAEVGNKFRTLLDALDDADPADTPEDQRRRPDQRLADALERSVDIGLDLGALPTVGGIARPHVSVLVDVATFDADLTDDADAETDRPVPPDHPVWADLPGADTAWGGALSPQTARRICCDAGVSRVVMAGPSQVLDVGRETRIWSPAQRRAVNARDRSCRGPACGRPIGWTQIHHLQWWRHGGETNLDNGIALCSSCHDLVHHAGWHADLDVTTAAVTWTSPDRRRTVVTHPRPPT
jgi:hypothetical protein